MKLSFIAIILITGIFAFSAEITGKIVRVSDGDTVSILDDMDKAVFKIRLAGIDAPESKQAFGQKSKQHLSGLIFGKVVSVRFKAVDSYGRIIGKIIYAEQDINLKMLQSGLAWHYRYFDDNDDYAKAESKAKEQKIGLWQDTNPVPPWDWRKLEKEKKIADKK